MESIPEEIEETALRIVTGMRLEKLIGKNILSKLSLLI